ncbi:MAG: hypothetical protein KUG64_10475, partial [Cycloclasticus sp.]|nr:hypothetical protein [Cycloclasticus sp.]
MTDTEINNQKEFFENVRLDDAGELIVKSSDYYIQHAIDRILDNYGDAVSVEDKNKDLLKFGRNKLVNTTPSTLMHLPAGTDNEAYISDNLINTVSSADSGDTEDILIEGHTVAAGVFTFIVQTATLNGQNQVTLTTPLARVSRVRNDGNTDLLGEIYIYQNDTDTNGVPDTNSLVHLITDSGLNNSEKAATTIANDE